VTYEEALEALLAFVGHRVRVIVEGEGGVPRGAALMSGTLVSGRDNPSALTWARESFGAELGEIVFFYVGDDALFTISRSDFRVGTAHDGGSLSIEAGGCVTHVFPA
jgi:hypothetical protein